LLKRGIKVPLSKGGFRGISSVIVINIYLYANGHKMMKLMYKKN
jgi:hypothetical protein